MSEYGQNSVEGLARAISTLPHANFDLFHFFVFWDFFFFLRIKILLSLHRLFGIDYTIPVFPILGGYFISNKILEIKIASIKILKFRKIVIIK